MKDAPKTANTSTLQVTDLKIDSVMAAFLFCSLDSKNCLGLICSFGFVCVCHCVLSHKATLGSLAHCLFVQEKQPPFLFTMIQVETKRWLDVGLNLKGICCVSVSVCSHLHG